MRSVLETNGVVIGNPSTFDSPNDFGGGPNHNDDGSGLELQFPGRTTGKTMKIAGSNEMSRAEGEVVNRMDGCRTSSSSFRGKVWAFVNPHEDGASLHLLNHIPFVPPSLQVASIACLASVLMGFNLSGKRLTDCLFDCIWLGPVRVSARMRICVCL